MTAAPRIEKEIVLDSVTTGIETRIVVFVARVQALDPRGDLNGKSEPLRTYFAQVYRRQGGTGEWSAPLHTTQHMPTDYHAEAAGRLWSRAHPLMLQPDAVPA